MNLTDIMAQLESGNPFDGREILLALCLHVKNLENKVGRLEAEAQCNPKT